MYCKILYAFYGRDTHSAQMLNLITSLWWVTAILLTLSDVVMFDLPLELATILISALIINVAIAISVLATFILKDRPKKLLKSFTLLVGALWQAILANMYVSQYPPMSMMMCVSVVLSLWFLGAVIFIARCEE